MQANRSIKYLNRPMPRATIRMTALIGVAALCLLLCPAPSSAFINGGDQLWSYRDKLDVIERKPGKQNPAASVTDSQGNTIITGSQLLPGSNFEEIYTVKISTGGGIVWRGVYQVSGMNARAAAVAVDASDNVYVTGVNDGSNSNVHIIRYNRDQAGIDASPQWQQTFDGGGTDKAAAITIFGGNVYVGGSSRFGGNECFMVLSLDKESGALSWQIPSASTSAIGKATALAADGNSIAVTGQTWNGAESYLATIAYNPNGLAALWQTPQPGAAAFQRNDSGLHVRIDSMGHVVVAGSVYNGLNTDIQTIKYCSGTASPCDGKTAGEILWQQTYDGGSDDEPRGLQLEIGATGKDDVYLTGQTLVSGRFHIHTARLKSVAATPQYAWGQNPVFNSGGDNTDIPTALVVSAADDALFVAGYSVSSAGNSDFRTVKYRKSTGDELWSRTFHGVADKSDRAIGAGLDLNGNLVVAGYVDETTPLDGGTSTATGGSKGTLVNSAKAWSVNAWGGYYLMMLSGVNNKDQMRQIQSNDATTLTFPVLLPDAVASGDSYYIYDKDDYDYQVVKYDKGILNAPTRLVATTISGSSVSLAWQDNNAVTPKFRLERCTAGFEHLMAVPCDFDNPAEVTVIPVTDGAVTAQADGLTADRYYYFRVRAYTGSDFASATQVTYSSNIEHAVTQTVSLIIPADSYSYAGVANSEDYALTIATGPIDGHPVVSGKSIFPLSGFDYYTIKLDKDNLDKMWSQRYDGPESQSDSAMCLTVDKNDQIIVSGYSWLYNLVASKDMNSIYTIKYKTGALSAPENDSDNYEWTHQYNGAGAVDDRPVAIAAASDSSNNIAVVGMGIHNEMEMSNHDIYVLHYPPAGPGPEGARNPGYWAASAIDKGGDDEPTSVVVDSSGDVIVTGFTMNTTRSRKDYDIYTARFAAANGALLWERIYDHGYGDDEANSVAVDIDGNVYVAGFSTNDQGNRDFITIKYDRDGNIQWGGAKIYDGPAHGDDEAVSVKVDQVDNHILVSGNQLTDTGNNDIHAIRYDSDGGVDWAKTVLREHTDEDMYDMTMDVSGSAYITATTTNSHSDPAINKDILTVKLDWLGTLAPDATIHGNLSELDKPFGITANYQGDVFIAGISQNEMANADYIVLKIAGDMLQSPYPVSYTNPTYNSVALNWTDSSRAETGYQVARRDGACPLEAPLWGDGEIITTAPAHLAANTVNFTDSGLTSRGTYCYGIRSFNGASYSRWANKTVVMATPPVPTVSANPADSTRITVAWTPQNGGQQTGFELWRCADSGPSACTDFTLLSASIAGTATSYDDQAVCAGTVYRYQLKSKGNGWTSDFSTTAGAIPPEVDNLAVDSGFETPDPMVAGQGVGWTYVGGVIASDITFDTAEKHGGLQSLNINAVGTATISGIKQYLLFAPGGKYQVSAWFKSAAPAGKVTCDLLDGASGSFTNSGTTSAWEQRSLTITTSTTPYPNGSRIRCYVAAGSQANIDDLQAIPLYELSATRYSESEIDLAWIDSAFDESGYQVERCNDALCASPQTVATVAANVSSYRDSRLAPDTSYWYRIRPYKTAPLSCNGGWSGGYSNTASALTANNTPVLTASSPNTTRVNLAWSDTTGTENQFRIERCLAASCSMTEIAALLANATGYSDTNACSDTVYNYQIRAVDQPLSLGNGGSWTRRVKLDFGATFSANKLTRVTLNQLTGMDATFKDIRFYDATAKQELSHWFESSAAGSATAWLKTGNNNDIHVYFGNGAAASTSSLANVFGSGLAGFWPFNETAETRSGTTADVSGNLQHATLNYFYSYAGYGVVAGGRYKNGLNLGAHSYSSASVADTTASLFDITDQITIELWYQYQKSPDWGRLASKMTTDGGQPWEMYGLWLDNTADAVATNPQQRVFFGIGSQDSPPGGTWPYYQSASGPQLTPGQWYHIVGRYDSATGRMSVFVNGVEYGVATHATKPKIIANNAAFYIGNRGTGNYMKGMLDEVRLYNRLLSDNEIATRYAAILPSVTTPVDGSVENMPGGYVFTTNWNGPYSKPTASSPTSAPTPIVTQKPANLTADPDFDNGATSWPTAVGTLTGTSFDTATTYSGTKSLKLTATGAVLGVLQNVSVIPNSEYTLSAYIKTALTAGAVQCDLYATGPPLLDSAGIISSGVSEWSYKSETVTIPGGITSVSVRCFANSGPQGQAWIDMVQLTPSIPVSAVAAVRKSEEQVDVSWTFPNGRDQTGFKVERCMDSSCASSTVLTALNAAVATATAGSYKYSDKNLAINSDYWYRVRAYKTEDPSCNGGKGFWETASTAIIGPVNTSFNASVDLSGISTVTTSCEDLRVTDTSGVAQKFYLENSVPASACNSSKTRLIVKVASTPTTGKTLYLYHGNLNAERIDDSGLNVFNFFDDFNGTSIDESKWIVAPNTGFSVSGGYLHGSNTSGRLASVNTSFYGSGYNLQAKVKSTLRPAGGFYPIGFSLYDNHYRSFGLIDYPSAHHYSNDNAGWTANLTTPPAGSTRNDSMIYSVVLKSTSVISPAIFDVDKNTTYWAPGDVANSNHSAAWNITLGRRYDATQTGQAYLADWDWVRIRKYVANAPVAGTPGAATPGTYSLSGETGSWRFLRQVAVTNTSGAVQTDYQVNLETDTTSMATDRNLVTWTASTDTETGFTLERCKDSSANCNASFVAEKTITGLPPRNSIGAQVSYLDRDLQLDSPQAPVNYCYRVKAIKSGGWLTAVTPGETPWSNIACMSTKLQAPPSNLTASATGTAINLSWTDNSTGENGFTLERCQDIAGDMPCSFAVGNNTSISLPPNDDKLSTTATYTDPNLCAGTYRYRISVYKNNPDSAGTSWTLGPVYLNGDSVSTELPPVPQNVVAARVSENQVRVTWKDMTADETGFEVWRCIGSTCTDFSRIPVTVAAAGGTGSTVTYNDSHYIVPGTTYRYKVRAYVIAACTVYSDLSADNSAAAPNGPDYATASTVAPSTMSAVASNSTQADLTWTDSSVSKSGMILGRCPGSAPCQTTYNLFPLLSASAVTYSDTSACADNTYNYQVYPAVHPAMPFANSGSQGWKSLSQLTIADFKPNFLTRVVITKGAMDMQDDFRDIRFFDRTTLAEFPYWIQSFGGTGSAATATVWFKTGANPTIDMYYNNPAATSSSSKDAVFGVGLAGYWPFEESARISGTISDVSGSANHLTMSGFDTLNTYGIVAGGRYGNTLSQDGINDYAYKGGIFAGLPTGSALSAEAWIYSLGQTYDYSGIVSWGSRGTGCVTPFTNFASVAMSVSAGGYPQVPTWCNDYVPGSGLQIPTNAWTHYAFTMNGREIKVYINGVAQSGSLDISKTVPNVNSRELAIGALELTGASRTFKGRIDEVRVYSRVLSADDIAARYSAVIPSVTVGPKSDTVSYGTASTINLVMPHPANIVANGEFDGTLTTKWYAWPDWNNVTQDSTVFHSGGKAIKLSKNLAASSAVTVYQSYTNFIPGGRYILTGSINASLGSSGESWCRLANGAVSVNYYSPQIAISASDATKNNQGWFRLSTPITLPLTAPGGGSITSLNIECGIRTTTAGPQTAYFDALQLVPDPPLVLTATAVSETEIDLVWNDLFGDETGFNLYRCQGAACDPVAVNRQFGAGIVKYRDSGLTPGESYSYKVTAYKTATCPWESSASDIKTVVTALVAPILRSVAPLTSTTMKINWSDTTSTENGYTLERCDGESCKVDTPVPVYSPIATEIQTAHDIESSLKARYTFNGNQSDISGSGLNLTSSSAPTYADNGILLHSMCGMTSANTGILNTDEHTIEFEFKLNADPGSTNIFYYRAGGSRYNPLISGNSTGRLTITYDPGFFMTIGSNGVNGAPFAYNNWYRLRVVKTGGKLNVFIDDRQIVTNQTVPSSQVAGGAAYPLNFGSCWNPNTTLRNFSIYNSGVDAGLVSYLDDKVCPSTYYKYRVTPNRATAWGQTMTSNALGATTPIFMSPKLPVTASEGGDTQINLGWSASDQNDQTGFVLKECPDGSSCSYPTTPNVTSYSRSGLSPETRYCYSVAAYKAADHCNGGAGVTSAYVDADRCITTYSARAGNLTAKALNSNKILLEWDDMSGDEDRFLIQKKIWNGQWVVREISAATAGKGARHSFIDTIGIQPLKKYTYRVVTVKGAVESPPSNEAVVTYTDPDSGATIETTPAFKGGMDKATCICTTVDGKEVCK